MLPVALEAVKVAVGGTLAGAVVLEVVVVLAAVVGCEEAEEEVAAVVAAWLVLLGAVGDEVQPDRSRQASRPAARNPFMGWWWVSWY
jgi:hypothetical protein